jgi:hypothetical protein
LDDIQNSSRYAIYRALWEVCKKASEYADNERERAVESLAGVYFRDRVAELASAYSNHDTRIQLEIRGDGAWPEVDLEEIEGGHALARAGLPSGSRVKLMARDGRASMTMPFEKFEIFVDSRYFLLQGQMREFLRKIGNVLSKWRAMEFAKAWAGAWLAGKVELSSSSTKIFFESAWDSHELDTFGSCDYLTSGQSLLPGSGDISLLDYDFKIPLESTRVSIEGAIEAIGKDDENFLALRALLDGMRHGLDEASDLLQKGVLQSTFQARETPWDSRTDEKPPEFKIDREMLYELLPPPPIRSVPGLTVYRELKVKSVRYAREDPAGLLGARTATPIPLPFHGATLWWGQFNITVDLEEWPVEEIFDFDNPTLPVAHGYFFAHKPLAYRWVLHDKSFGTSVTVLSLKQFNVIPAT